MERLYQQGENGYCVIIMDIGISCTLRLPQSRTPCGLYTGIWMGKSGHSQLNSKQKRGFPFFSKWSIHALDIVQSYLLSGYCLYCYHKQQWNINLSISFFLSMVVPSGFPEGFFLSMCLTPSISKRHSNFFYSRSTLPELSWSNIMLSQQKEPCIPMQDPEPATLS